MLSTDDLRRRGQTGLYGYPGHSGKNLSKAYYMLEPKNTNANRSADQRLGQTGPDQTGRFGLRDIISEGGGDEESQRSASRMIKGPDSASTDEHFGL